MNKTQVLDIELIKEYIPEEDALKKFIDYFERHEIIGEEIFAYLGEKYRKLSDFIHYHPVSKDAFIKRLPFYFYEPNLEKDNVGSLSQYVQGLWSRKFDKEKIEANLERLYYSLENMLYKFKIDIETIFEYPIKQSGYVSRTEDLFSWAHYLELADQFGITDKTPKHLIVAYNYMLERANLSPIIYEITETFIGEYVRRSGNILEFEGTFPCDENGQPIMRWIGLKVKNAAAIWTKVNDRLKGSLYIEITPKTSVWGMNCWKYEDDGTDDWYELYIAPQLMEFDNEAIKKSRKQQKLTQQQVADAIGATLRTYQKWESGTTTPDCRYLLRLMNALDIKEIQQLTKITEL